MQQRYLDPNFQQFSDKPCRGWVSGLLSEQLRLPHDVKLAALPMFVVQGALHTRSCDSTLSSACATMSAKRCTEFIAGRLCAAQALQEMRIPAEFPLPTSGRLPRWPTGVLGSISHCTQLAAAVTAAKSKYQALGIDVECSIPSAAAHEIQPNVCQHEELARLAPYMPDLGKALTMLFSAKEALYKALFPSVRQFMDFGAAELCHCEDGVMVLQLTRDWAPRWRVGTHIAVRRAWVGSVIVTVVCIPNDANASCLNTPNFL